MWPMVYSKETILIPEKRLGLNLAIDPVARAGNGRSAFSTLTAANEQPEHMLPKQ